MNKPIRRVATACLLLFVILLINANGVQFAEAKNLRDKPGNSRLLLQQYDTIERGRVRRNARVVCLSRLVIVVTRIIALER